MPKKKAKPTQGGARDGAGRPALGADKRSHAVSARFTEAEYERLQREAEADGVTVAELVVRRALA